MTTYHPDALPSSVAAAADLATILASCSHPDATRALLTSCPHPDCFAQDIVRALRASVDAFKSDAPGAKALPAIVKAFKDAASALDLAAPAHGQHLFKPGERIIVRDLKQRADLNGCVGVVKTAADDVDGDGRVDVSVTVGGKKEMLRLKPLNLQLEWHCAAKVHVTCVGRNVILRTLDSVAQNRRTVPPLDSMVQTRLTGGTVRRVVSYDAASQCVALHEEASSGSALVSIADVFPAAYQDIAEEVHGSALKLLAKAVAERHTPAVVAAFAALQSCVVFKIRCAREDEAAHYCCTVLKDLHTGGRIVTARDAEVRRSWTGDFLITCTNYLYCHFRNSCGFEAAVSVLVMCKMIVADNEGEDSVNVAAIHHNIATLCEQLDLYEDAEVEYKNALRITELKLGRSSEPVGDILLGLGALHEKQNRLDDAVTAYTEALNIFEEKKGHDTQLVAQVLANLAVIQDRLELRDVAEKTYEEAMRIKVLVFGKESLDVAEILNNLAGLYQKQHRLSDAAAALQEALRIRVTALGKETLDVADTLGNLARLFTLQNRLEEAENLHMEALRIRKLKLGADSFKVATSIHSIAVLYKERGLLDRAEEMFKDALAIVEYRLGIDSVHAVEILSDLGLLLEQQGRLRECEFMLLEALRIRVKGLGRQTLETATSLEILGGFFERQGRVSEAQNYFEEALRIQESKLGKGNIGASSARNRLSELHPPPLSDI
jgi:tetratricopeptide (TPR) repeat protein